MLKETNPVLVIVGVVVVLCLAGFAIYHQTSAPTETISTTTTLVPADETTGQANTAGTTATPVTREQSPGMQP